MKKIIKRTTAILLMLIMCGVVNVFAKMPSYVLMYENTFDNGPADLVRMENDYLSLKLGVDLPSREADFNGNRGIRKRYYDWAADEKTLVYSMKNGGISSGIVRLCFDFSTTSESTADGMYIGMNMTSHYQGGVLMALKKQNGEIRYNLTPQVGNSFAPTEYTGVCDDKALYSAEFILNFDEKQASFYLNDVQAADNAVIPQQYTTLTELSFTVTGHMDYLDNIKIEYFDVIPMRAEAKAEDDYIRVDFSDYYDTMSLLDAEYRVKNLFTGTECSAVGTRLTGNALKIVPSVPLQDGYEYAVILPEGIRGVNGGTLENTEASFAAGEGKYLVHFAVMDFSEREYIVSDNVAAESDRLIFEFSPGVDAAVALDGMTVTENSGTNIAYTVNSFGNIATVKLDRFLLGNSKYRISLSNVSSVLDKNYLIDFSTAPGKIAVEAINFLVNDVPVTTFSGVKNGDTVQVRMDYIKTTRESGTFLASAALWNNLDMTDYDYEIVTMAEDEQKRRVEFDFVISNCANSVLKAFMWKDLGKINPLFAEKILR